MPSLGGQDANGLLELKATAVLASTAGTCDTSDLPAALSALATLIGMEPRLRELATTAETEMGRLSAQILAALHPGPSDFTPPLSAPWNRKNLRTRFVTLAENAIADAARSLATDPGSPSVWRGIGFGALLKDAKCNLVPVGKRGEYLIGCAERIGDCLLWNGSPSSVGYAGLPDADDRQLLFDFYKQNNSQP